MEHIYLVFGLCYLSFLLTINLNQLRICRGKHLCLRYVKYNMLNNSVIHLKLLCLIGI